MKFSPAAAEANAHIVAAVTLAHSGDVEGALRYLAGLNGNQLFDVAVGAIGQLMGVLVHAGVDVNEYAQSAALIVCLSTMPDTDTEEA